MHLRKLTLALLIVAPAISSASQLPIAGTCKYEDVSSGIDFGVTANWSGNQATISTSGQRLPGNVVGLREHDDRFKLSLRYEDPIMGRSEIVIFEMPRSNPPLHRLATVHYNRLNNGDFVVSSLTGFKDAVCALIY